MTDIKPLINRCINLAPGEEMPTERLIREAGLDPEDRALYKEVATALAKLPSNVGTYKIGRKGRQTRFIRASDGSTPPPTPSAPRAVLAPLAPSGHMPRTDDTPFQPIPRGSSPTESMPEESDPDDTHTVAPISVTAPEVASMGAPPLTAPAPVSTLSSISQRVEQIARTKGFVVMTAQLRPGMYIPFGLPKDVTQAEIERLVMFLQNLYPDYRDIPNNAEISTQIHDAHGRSIL